MRALSPRLCYSGSTQDTGSHCEPLEKKVGQGIGFTGEGRGQGHLGRSSGRSPLGPRPWGAEEVGTDSPAEAWTAAGPPPCQRRPQPLTNEDASTAPNKWATKDPHSPHLPQGPRHGSPLRQGHSGSCWRAVKGGSHPSIWKFNIFPCSTQSYIFILLLPKKLC